VTSIVVRPPVLADADDIGRVHIVAWQVGYRGQMPDEYLDRLSIGDRQAVWRQRLTDGLVDNVMFVAEDPLAGHVCGWVGVGALRPEATADCEPGTGELWALNLEPEAWGRGIATALMAAAVQEMEAQGWRRAILWVLDSNARGRRFYEREGWTADGAAKIDVERGFDLHELRYGRALAPPEAE